ncbi:MAG: aminotransferase class V-fold PLP-dependent enzyme [Bacillota bacterium]
MQTTYLDNAATSFPKPAGVSERMRFYIDEIGATVNRSVYGPAAQAGLTALSLRERLCGLLGYDDPTHCILTPGATASLNMAIKGYLKPGDHCIVSSLEHNAVMRPLMQLRESGVTFSRIPADEYGRMRVELLESTIQKNTRLIAVSHASNVFGVLHPAEEIGRVAAKHGIPFLLDAAQTAGHYPVDFNALRLSALSVPAHKGLLGPSGIGALLMTKAFAASLTPLIAGGTGSASDSEELPPFMPDRFESGTPNLPGIFGWEESLRFVSERGVTALRAHEMQLTMRFIEGIGGEPGVRVVGPLAPEERVGVVSLDFPGRDNAQISFSLEQEYGILTRCGLHCAPNAHKSLGTFPAGTVRFSFGWANTIEDVDRAIQAVVILSKE